jgi:hypothetical protein
MGMSPFEANYSWLLKMVESLELDEPQFKGVQDFVDQALSNVSAVHDALITTWVFQTHTANKRCMEDPPLKEGNHIYLSTEKLNLPKGHVQKLLPLFVGPYLVVKAHPNSSTYTLELPPELVKCNIHPTFHVSRIHMHIPNDDVRFPK